MTICISDSGVGIPQTLRASDEHKAYLRDEDDTRCLEYALGKGISSKKNQNHSGEGLFWTSEFIKANGGEMHVLSGDAMMQVTNEGVLLKTIPKWFGTLIVLKYQIQANASINDLFDSESDGSFDDEIDDLFV